MRKIKEKCQLNDTQYLAMAFMMVLFIYLIASSAILANGWRSPPWNYEESQVEALRWFSSQPQGVTVSNEYSLGIFYVLSRKLCITEGEIETVGYMTYEEVVDRLISAKVLFLSADLREVRDIIVKYNITYVFFWKIPKVNIILQPNDAYLQKFSYLNGFVKIYENEAAIIWKVNLEMLNESIERGA
jgi:uncharacterized membrane protein